MRYASIISILLLELTPVSQISARAAIQCPTMEAQGKARGMVAEDMRIVREYDELASQAEKLLACSPENRALAQKRLALAERLITLRTQMEDVCPTAYDPELVATAKRRKQLVSLVESACNILEENKPKSHS